MSQSFASTRGRSSRWPHSIKAWRPHTLLWCSPALEEEQVCHMTVGLDDLSDSLCQGFPRPQFEHPQFCVFYHFYLKNYCGYISQIFLQHAVTQSKSILISRLKFFLSAYRQANEKRLHCFIRKHPLTQGQVLMDKIKSQIQLSNIIRSFLSFYILFYYQPLEVCLFSNERQKASGSRRKGGPRRSRAGGSWSQVILFEKVHFQSQVNKKKLAMLVTQS